MICIELQLSQDADAAIFSMRPEEAVIVDQDFGSEVTQVLQFPGTDGPTLSIYGSTFYFFYIDDADTSLLVRSSASPVNYKDFRGYAAALAAGSLIGTSSWLVDEPHVDAWGEARWGVHENWADEVHPQRDYFTSDTPLGGELGLQGVPAYQNPGQQGGRYFCGVGWRQGDGFHYGWMELQGVGGTQMSILAWAWESTPNVPIAAGAIPEPSALLLLAGASVVLTSRRRLKESV